MLYFVNVRCEARAGAEVGAAAEEAVMLARKVNDIVVFVHNDTEVSITAGMTARDVVDGWWRARNERDRLHGAQ